MKKLKFLKKAISLTVAAVIAVEGLMVSTYAAPETSGGAEQTTTVTCNYGAQKGKLPGPEKVNAVRVKTNSVKLEWNKVTGADAYLMWYRKSGTKKWLSVKNEKKSSAYTTDTRQEATRLKPGVLYEFQVKSYRIINRKYVAQGASEIYTAKTATKDGIMPAHPNIKARLRANRVDFTWSGYNMVPGNGSAFSIIQQWNGKTGKWETKQNEYGRNIVYEHNCATMYGLKPGKTYKFKIITIDSMYFYDTQDSRVIKIKTPECSKGEWDGTADTSWYTDDKDSFDITTAEQLAGFAKLVENGNTFRGKTVNLMKDIKLNDTSDWKEWVDFAPANKWKPIGGDFEVFSGVFNGHGHTIRGLYITSHWTAGLFGNVGGAVIANVRIKECVIHRGDGCNEPGGALISVSQDSIIEACEVDDMIYEGKTYGVAREIPIGGMIGKSGKISYSAYVMYFVLMGFGVAINPIVFAAMEDNGNHGTYIDSCKVNNISINMDKANAGGIIGGGEAIFMTNCLSTNVKIASSYDNGAMVSYGTGEIKNCYSYNYQMTGNKKVQYDREVTTTITKKELISASFAKKLGDYFIYSKGNAPALKSPD